MQRLLLIRLWANKNELKTELFDAKNYNYISVFELHLLIYYNNSYNSEGNTRTTYFTKLREQKVINEFENRVSDRQALLLLGTRMIGNK